MSEQFNQYGTTPQNNGAQQAPSQGQGHVQNVQNAAGQQAPMMRPMGVPQNAGVQGNNMQNPQQMQQMPQGQGMPQQAPMRPMGVPQNAGVQGNNMQNPQQMQQMQQGQGMPQQAPMRPMNAPQNAGVQGNNMQSAQNMQQTPQGQQQMQNAQRPAQQNAGSLQQQAQKMAAQQAAMRNAQPQGAQNMGAQQMGGAQMPQARQGAGAPKPADGPGVQIILRMFQPDMNLLKVTARQLAELPHIKLNLYGQGGEVLVVITAEGRTAPATELCENAASQMEAAMGDVVYSRGKTSLANYVAKLLNKNEFNLMAPDEETGTLIETEFKGVEKADKVYDFGQDSYHNSKMANKIADAAIMDDEESDDPVQLASDRSFAAKKCTKADFGVSIASVASKGTMAVAVTYGKFVYITSFRMADDANKKAALSAFDMIRRLVKGMEIPYARTFKAAQEIDWNEPVLNAKNKGANKKGKGDKALIVPIIVLIFVSIALGVGIWYVVQNFIITDESAMPVGSEASTSQPADTTQSEGTQETDTAEGETSETVEEGGEQTGDAANESASQSEGQTGENGDSVVHPFG